MTYPSFLANLWSGFFSVGSSQEKQTGDSVADVLPVDFKVDSLSTSMTTTPQGRLRGSSNMKEGYVTMTSRIRKETDYFRTRTT